MHIGCDHLFHCGEGSGSFNVGYDGTFRLCSSLWAPGTKVNLRETSLRAAWGTLVRRARAPGNRRHGRRDAVLLRGRSCARGGDTGEMTADGGTG